jgi:class 3 adenylate cyclase
VILHLRLSNLLQRMDLVNNLRRTQTYLNRYISPRTREMVDIFADTGIMPQPEEHEICVMFCDIRGFTALTQEIPPAVLFDLLSTQLGEQTELVFQHDGYIDNTSGDGQMAVFEGDDKAARACHCALAIMEKTRQHVDPDGKHAMTIGIGINLGKALIGNIGSSEHLDYSAIGVTVNVAARLCGIAEPMSIIVSEPVYAAVRQEKDLAFSEARQISVRGIQKPMLIYRLIKGVRHY